MQPMLRGDTLFVQMADGIYLRNNQETLIFKGQEIYQWFAALEPYLNGQYTLEAIIDDLEPAQQEIVREIVESLLAHGFVRDRTDDEPHTLNERELTTYAGEIAFIESFHDSAAATFARFRAQHVLVIGSGIAFLALTQATLRGGVRETTVWITDECDTHTQRLQAYREQSHQRDPTQLLLEQSSPNWRDERALKEALEPYDIIFHLSDRPMLQRTLTLNKLCFNLQKRFFPALIVDHQALIGPLVSPGAPGCWECAWRRWLAQGNAAAQQLLPQPWQDRPTAPISPLLGLPTAATVAHVLSFECFKYLTEASSCEIDGKVVQFELETLRGEGHPFLPHPLCQTCQHPTPLDALSFLESMHRLETQDALEEEIFSKRAVSCFDPSLGIFTYLGEDDFVQMPLNVSRLTVSAPMNAEQAQDTVTLTDAHLSLDATRHRLTLTGASLYAARLVDRRRLSAGANGVEALAYDLHSKQARRVLAAEAYPEFALRQVPSILLGVGTGLSWAEACTRGLLDHSLALALQEVRQGVADCTEMAVNVEALGNQTKHLHALVAQTRTNLHIVCVTGSLRVPVLAFCVGDETIAYTAHFNIGEALHEGLERILQHFQSLSEDQPEYALPSVLQLPTVRGGGIGSLPDGPTLSGWQEGLDWLLEMLQQARWRVAAVPLNHDPALSEILPFLVRIVLTRDEA